MAVYAVSFRIERDITYQSRYDSFVEQLRSVGVGHYWEETTSFVIVETSESIDDFCHRIYFSSKVLDSKDLFFVLDVNAKAARVRGPNPYPNILRSLVPFVVKLD